MAKLCHVSPILPNTYIWFTEATPNAILIMHYMLLCHCPGVSKHWHLILRFSMVTQIPFGKLTIVLDITGRCKVHSSPSSLDPEIRVKSPHLGWAWAFISSNPTSSSAGKGMSREVRPEHRLPGPYSAHIYQVLWPSTLGLASRMAKLLQWPHQARACESCQQFAELLGVTMSSVFRCKYTGASPWMIPPKMGRATLKNPAESTGRLSWLQPAPKHRHRKL